MPASPDLLDPFSEEKIFETKDIRRSKSRKQKNRTGDANALDGSDIKNKVIPHKSIKAFFKELPERADKKRIYVIISAVAFALLAIVALFIINTVSQLQARKEEERREAIETRVVEISNIISDFVDEEADEEIIRREIYKLLPEVQKDSSVYASLILGLVALYERNNQYQAAIDLLEDEQNDESVGNSNRIEFLLRLNSLYDATNQNDMRKYTMERLLSFKSTTKDVVIEEGSWKEIREEIEEAYYEIAH